MRVPANAAAPADTAGRRAALVAAATGGFLTPFMGSAVTIALPAIAAEFGLDAVSLGWVTSAFLLAASALLLPSGRLADIVGQRRVFITGLTVFAVATLICAVAPSGGVLIGLRLLQGVAGALIFGTGTAILTSVYSPARLGRALGVAVACVYLGLSLGPFVGGMLTAWVGWRGIFLFTAPLAAGAAVLVAVRLQGEWAEAEGERFDLVGAVLYCGALTALMVGLGRVFEPAGVALAAIGVLGLGVFFVWEASARSPLLDLLIFRDNPVFTYSNVGGAHQLQRHVRRTVPAGLYLQFVRGFTVEPAGAILVVQPVVQSLVSPLAGRLSERIDPRILASAGMGVITVGLFVLATLAETTRLSLVLTLLALLGFGFALFSSPAALRCASRPSLTPVSAGSSCAGTSGRMPA
jgi:MFS family permease